MREVNISTNYPELNLAYPYLLSGLYEEFRWEYITHRVADVKDFMVKKRRVIDFLGKIMNEAGEGETFLDLELELTKLKEEIDAQKGKPDYDDLIFLIAFIWKWRGDARMHRALSLNESYIGEAADSVSLYKLTLKIQDFNRARKILWSVKDEITKINGFWE